MKRITTLIVSMLAVLACTAQVTYYVPINDNSTRLRQEVNSTFHIPAGANPTLNNGKTRAGAQWLDSINNKQRYWQNGSWKWTPDSAAVMDMINSTSIPSGIDDVLNLEQPLSTNRKIQGDAATTSLSIETGLTIAKPLTLTGFITAPVITANVTNFDPPGLDSALVVRISANDSVWLVRGVESAGVADGRIIYFENIGGYTITFRSANGTPDENSIILEPGLFGPNVRAIRVPPYATLALKYNLSLQKWMVLHAPVKLQAGTGIAITNSIDYGATTISINTSTLPAWTTTGNSGISSGIHFFGTTNDENINIRLHNIRSGKITKDSGTHYGFEAGLLQATGINTFIAAFGAGANRSNVSGTYISAFGENALYNNLQSFNTAFGARAMFSNTTGDQSAAFGALTLVNNTTGLKNSAFGVAGLENNTTGSFNSGLGQDVMLQNTTGSENTGVGWLAWSQNRTGHYSVGIGSSSGRSVVNGTKVVAIGYNSMYNVSQEDTVSNAIAIGADTWTTKSNQMVLGNTSITETLIRGITRLDGASKKMVLVDTISHIITYTDIPTGGIGSVSSVATNDGTGILGGTITTTGTLAIDTTHTIATILQVQHRIDSLASTITGGSTITFGTDNQIPIMNSGGTDFEYTDAFQHNGTNLDLKYGGLTLLMGADASATTRTNNTAKSFIIAAPHYANAEENVAFVKVQSFSGTNTLQFGGGDAAYNAPNEMRFYVGSTATTVTGTEHLRIHTNLVHINQPQNNVDFIISGQTDVNNLFSDASTNRVGIGTATPLLKLTVNGGADGNALEAFRVETTTRSFSLGLYAGDWATLKNTHGSNNNAGFQLLNRQAVSMGSFNINQAYLPANVTIGTVTVPTSATKSLTISSGTNPSASVTDAAIFYTADITAGNAAIHTRTENGQIIKLYQHAAVTTPQEIADALTALGFLASSTISSTTTGTGSHAPTLTNQTNIASSTPYDVRYSRVDDEVTVSGKVDITANATGAVELRMTVPISTATFTEDYQAGGVASARDKSGSVAMAISSVPSTSLVAFRFVADDTNTHTYWFIYKYTIFPG